MSKKLSNVAPGKTLPGVETTTTIGQIYAGEENNSRKFKSDPKSIQRLKNDLSFRGQMFPLLVRENNGNTYNESLIAARREGVEPEDSDKVKEPYILIDGFRRFEALSLLWEESGNGTDPAVVVRVLQFDPSDTELAAYRTSIAANNPALREAPSPVAVAYQILDLKAKGMTGVEIAKDMGVSQGLVSRYMSMTTLRAEIQKRIHTGEIPVSIALELVGLDEEQQNTVLAKVEAARTAGKNLREAAQAGAKEARGGKRKGAQGRKAKKDKGAGLSMKVMVRGLEQLSAQPEPDPETGKEQRETKTEESTRLIFGLLLRFVNGKLGVAALRNQVMKLV